MVAATALIPGKFDAVEARLNVLSDGAHVAIASHARVNDGIRRTRIDRSVACIAGVSPEGFCKVPTVNSKSEPIVGMDPNSVGARLFDPHAGDAVHDEVIGREPGGYGIRMIRQIRLNGEAGAIVTVVHLRLRRIDDRASEVDWIVSGIPDRGQHRLEIVKLSNIKDVAHAPVAIDRHLLRAGQFLLEGEIRLVGDELPVEFE